MEEWEKHFWNILEMATTEVQELWQQMNDSVEVLAEDIAQTFDLMTEDLADLISVEFEDLSEFLRELIEEEGSQEQKYHISALDDEMVRDRAENTEELDLNQEYSPLNNINNITESLNSLNSLNDFEVYHTPKIEPCDHFHPACIGCQNYHGHIYGRNLLVCGMHPYGWDDDNCPDFVCD
jgi:hypothetical protein